MFRYVGKYVVNRGTRFFSDEAAKKTSEVTTKVVEEIASQASEEIAPKAASEIVTKTADEKATTKITENITNHPQLGTLYGPYVRTTTAESRTNTEAVVAFQPEFKKSGIGTDIIGKFFDFLTPTEAKSSSQVFYSPKPPTESLMDTPAGSTVKWESDQFFHPAVTVEQGKPNINDHHLVEDLRDKITNGIPRLPESLHSIYNQTLDTLLPRKSR